MKIKILASSSKGNAYIYNNILVDCGIPFSSRTKESIKDNIKEIDIVLITHRHGDHFNKTTAKKIMETNPRIVFMAEDEEIITTLTQIATELPTADKIKIIALVVGKKYKVGKNARLQPIRLYHDVLNVGFRIFFDDYKIFHATDTKHLEGITAKDYDLYVVECNYSQKKYNELYNQYNSHYFSNKKDLYVDMLLFENSVNTHLSDEQFEKFIEDNAGKKSKVIKAHCSAERL